MYNISVFEEEMDKDKRRKGRFDIHSFSVNPPSQMHTPAYFEHMGDAVDQPPLGHHGPKLGMGTPVQH